MFNFRLIASPLLVGFILTSGLLAGEIQILQRAPDPFGYPRPFPNQKHVPLNSSLFFLLGLEPASDDDQIEMTSIQVELSCADSEPVKLVEHGKPTLQGIHCLIEVNRRPPASVAVNLELERPLLPNIWYTVVVAAQSRSGQRMADGKQSWKFRTGSWDLPETLDLDFDMRQTPIQWKGGFFTGFCKPSFCTSATNRIPGYDLMSELRKDFPRSWSLQRDFSLMGSEQRESWISPRFPGLVRELETRNIVSMVRTEAGVELTLEDFFGHEQYGIASLRPLHLDYHPKDLVLIADGSNSVQVEVIRVLRSEQCNRQHLLV